MLVFVLGLLLLFTAGLLFICDCVLCLTSFWLWYLWCLLVLDCGLLNLSVFWGSLLYSVALLDACLLVCVD